MEFEFNLLFKQRLEGEFKSWKLWFYLI